MSGARSAIFGQLLTTASVLPNLRGEDPQCLLGALADGLIAQCAELAPRREEILAALLAREAQGSTASQGVAIPHVKLPGVPRAVAVIGVHREGAPFSAIDGSKVHVFFSMIRPAETAEQHLGVLRWFAGVAQHPDFVSFARQVRGAEELLALLDELTAE